MTAHGDFSEQEWTLVLEGPTSAGLHVIIADRGGSVRETYGMAKAYGEARRRAGESELLDAIVAAKPAVDRTRPKSTEALKLHLLRNISDAAALVEQKATAAELEQYRSFVIGLAERVAEARREGFMGIRGERVSDDERAALEQIAEALGTEAPPPPAPA